MYIEFPEEPLTKCTRNGTVMWLMRSCSENGLRVEPRRISSNDPRFPRCLLEIHL